MEGDSKWTMLDHMVDRLRNSIYDVPEELAQDVATALTEIKVRLEMLEQKSTMPPCQSLDKALMQSTSESAAGSTPTPTN